MPIADLAKVITPAIVAFVIGVAATPLLTHYLYKYKAWKKKPGKVSLDGTEAVEFNKLHETTDSEKHTPRLGGIVIWGSVFITTFGMAALALLQPGGTLGKLNFLSRDQTWIPLMTLLVGAFVGFINDFHDIRGSGKGLRARMRLLIVFLLSLFVGWWFYDKLDVTAIGIPFASPLEIGWLIIPFFIFVSLAIYSSGVIDGIDGLSGGVFASIFASYAIIAFIQQQLDLAAFCAALLGATLAFLWFNIPPARFYMTETGTMALTLTIAVIAFMTDTPGEGIGVAVLPIIGALLVATVVSVMLQLFWKKVYKRKLFRIAPLHHHFEAIGWPGYKVVMRYWVLSVVFAAVGVIIALIGS